MGLGGEMRHANQHIDTSSHQHIITSSKPPSAVKMRDE